jgi:hypothetical protein
MIDKKSQINCMNHDIDDTIFELIKVSSQGSLVLSDTATNADTTDDSSSQQSEDESEQQTTSQRQVLK